MNRVYLARLSEAWHRALQANGVPCDPDLATHFLIRLLDLLLAALTTEPFCPAIVQSTGVALAIATHAHAQALAVTDALFVRELPLLLQRTSQPLSDERLGALLDGFRSGFSDYTHMVTAHRRADIDTLPIAFDLLDTQLCHPILSARDCQVLRELAVGQTNRRIGQSLGLSEKAIERRVSVLCSKLGVSSRAALAAYAVRTGLA